MLRVHFTAADLGRIRVAAATDPLWEVVLSLEMVRGRHAGRVFGQWRSEVRSLLGDDLLALLELTPAHGGAPDFLTPANDSGDLEEGLDAVRSTPPVQVARQLHRLVGDRPTGTLTSRLLDGDPGALDDLVAALRAYHAVALHPHWNRIRARFEVERAAKARAFLDGAAGELLASVHPSARWAPPVLEVEHRVKRDVHLDGRGITLLPSFFCWQRPSTLRDPDLPPVLVYPMVITPGWTGEGPAGAVGDAQARGSLAALLGRTRAAVLQAAAAGCTTSELSQQLDISPASASEHTTVLRKARLLSSRRNGPAVHHEPTPLGLNLLGEAGGQ
jgi:hypothetical protein